MLLRSIRRQLLVVAALAMAAGTAQSATVYQLQSITFNTSSAPGTYTFGAGPLAASQCISCGLSTVTDDGAGNLTVGQIQYLLKGFGADFTNTFSGTSTLGTTSLIKTAGETCVVNNAATHLCNPADHRGFAGNLYNGLMADGTTASPPAQFSALVSGQNLVLRVRKARDDLFDPNKATSTAWLQMNFNYSVVPVPAAVWLFGSALGLLGIARRRSIAARA